jgi:methyl-accepting chemotaxis protein
MMKKFSFRWRLALGFAAVLVVGAVVGAVGYQSTYRMSDEADGIALGAKEQNLTMEMEWALAEESAAVRSYLITADPAARQQFDTAEKHFQENAGELNGIQLSSEDRGTLEDLRSAEAQGTADYGHILKLRQDGETAQASALAFSPEVKERAAHAMDRMETLDDSSDRVMSRSIAGHDAAEVSVRETILLVGLTGILAGILCAWLIGRSITRPVHRLVESLQAVEANDLSFEDLEIGSEDEFGKAALALNTMKNNLHQVVLALASTAARVAEASRGILENANHTVRGAENQQGQMQMVATSITEMSATVHEISKSTNQAAQSAREAEDKARAGGKIVEEALERMRSISQAVHAAGDRVTELGNSSEQIGRIVAVIREIAEQTNLLALNAAIEAARAGEQGRGFAVVAGEVRRLAERTTNATREISGMIESVQAETRAVVETMHGGTEEVERGVAVTGSAGNSLREIIEQASHVGVMVNQIASATTEQSAATGEVSAAAESISQQIRQYTQEAQNSEGRCRELTEMAEQLQGMVSRFRLAGGRPSAPRTQAEKIVKLDPAFAAGQVRP